MKKDIKLTDTGTPYQITSGTTAKNFSYRETTSPQDNSFFTLNEVDIIEDCIIITDVIIQEE